jgi:transposase
VLFLPSYSPELNPDERFNADLKQAMRFKPSSRQKGHLKNATLRQMERIARSAARVRKYFDHPTVQYAKVV